MCAGIKSELVGTGLCHDEGNSLRLDAGFGLSLHLTWREKFLSVLRCHLEERVHETEAEAGDEEEADEEDEDEDEDEDGAITRGNDEAEMELEMFVGAC